MMLALAGLLCLSDVALALWVFLVLARPERVLGWLAKVGGMRERWLAGRLTEQDEARLLRLAAELRAPLLALLLAWSFLCGAVLTLARL